MHTACPTPLRCRHRRCTQVSVHDLPRAKALLAGELQQHYNNNHHHHPHHHHHHGSGEGGGGAGRGAPFGVGIGGEPPKKRRGRPPGRGMAMGMGSLHKPGAFSSSAFAAAMLHGRGGGGQVMMCHPGGIVVSHVPVAHLRPISERVPGLRFVSASRRPPARPPVAVEGRNKPLDRRVYSGAIVSNGRLPDLEPGALRMCTRCSCTGPRGLGCPLAATRRRCVLCCFVRGGATL